MLRAIEGHGTPEPQWQAWLAHHPLPILPARELLAACRRIVIVAPHPDDEVLGAAGLMRHGYGMGMPCIVVAVTDGDASHPGSAYWPRDRLVKARVSERAQALGLLAPTALVIRLGIPDGQVAEHAPQLTAALSRLLEPGDAVFCTWREDGHPDHEATGHACATATYRAACMLYELPIWTWHWAAQGDWRVPWHRAVAVPLAPGDLDLKRQALACFRSQLQPDPSTERDAILADWVTRRLLRPFEVVFT